MEPADDLWRRLAPQVVSLLTRRWGDFHAAEDAVQEALVAAAEQWPRDGLPRDPRAWLVAVASRRMVEQVRSEQARRRREDVVAASVPAYRVVSPAADDARSADQDDSLLLLFLCCHPVLSDASAVALTLRSVGGLTTAQVAAAFLVPEATMAQRISRAKRTLAGSGATFDQPRPEEWPSRLDRVLRVLYLVFTEGHTSSSGEALQRPDLADEAVRLCRLLRRLLPHEPEVAGLLALMLLTDARRAARTGPSGELVPLDEQDRTSWDQRLVAEGVALVTEALPQGRVGPYQLQAAIAAVHDEAPSAQATDWPQVLALYDVLLRIADTPVVRLNRAVALGQVAGPAHALQEVARLAQDRRLAAGHRLHAVRGHLLERLGDPVGAAAAYRTAARRTASIPERDYLLARAHRVSPD